MWEDLNGEQLQGQEVFVRRLFSTDLDPWETLERVNDYGMVVGVENTVITVKLKNDRIVRTHKKQCVPTMNRPDVLIYPSTILHRRMATIQVA